MKPEAFIERCGEDLAVWRATWPNDCKTCGGWGESEYNFAIIPTFGLNVFEKCDNCVAAGLCPRCGRLTLREFPGVYDLGEGPCAACGWNYDDGEPRWPPTGSEPPSPSSPNPSASSQEPEPVSRA